MGKNYYDKFFSYLPDSCGYKSYTKENWEFIDKINLEPYIEKYKILEDLISQVEDDYRETSLEIHALEGYVFNWISIDEFAEYIYDKYNVKYREDYHHERI